MSRGGPSGIRITQRDLAERVDGDFSEEKEYWNTYHLDDGTTLKMKVVLRSVRLLKRFNPDGTPIYLIQSQNIVRTVNMPEHLKAKPTSQAVNPV